MSFDTARCCANEADLNGGFVGTYTFSGGLTGQVAGTLFHSDNTMSGSVTLTSDYCLRTLTACSTSAQCLEGDTCYHQVLISSVSGNVVCDAITIGNVGGLATFTGTASGSCIDGDWSAPPFGGTWQACR